MQTVCPHVQLHISYICRQKVSSHVVILVVVGNSLVVQVIRASWQSLSAHMSLSTKFKIMWAEKKKHIRVKERMRSAGTVFRLSSVWRSVVRKMFGFFSSLQGNTSAALLPRRKRAALRTSFLLLVSCRLTPSWWQSSSRSWTRWACLPFLSPPPLKMPHHL